MNPQLIIDSQTGRPQVLVDLDLFLGLLQNVSAHIGPKNEAGSTGIQQP